MNVRHYTSLTTDACPVLVEIAGSHQCPGAGVDREPRGLIALASCLAVGAPAQAVLAAGRGHGHAAPCDHSAATPEGDRHARGDRPGHDALRGARVQEEVPVVRREALAQKALDAAGLAAHAGVALRERAPVMEMAKKVVPAISKAGSKPHVRCWAKNTCWVLTSASEEQTPVAWTKCPRVSGLANQVSLDWAIRCAAGQVSAALKRASLVPLATHQTNLQGPGFQDCRCRCHDQARYHL